MWLTVERDRYEERVISHGPGIEVCRISCYRTTVDASTLQGGGPGFPMSLDDSLCQLTDEVLGNNELFDEFFCCMSSEIESAEDVQQYDAANENCSQAVPFVDVELHTSDATTDSDHAVVTHGEERGAVRESELSCLDVDKLQCSPVEREGKCVRNVWNDVLFDDLSTRVDSDVEPLEDVEQHCSTVEMSDRAVLSAAAESHACSDEVQVLKADTVPQECFTDSVDVLEPGNESPVIDIAVVEIPDDRSDVSAVHEETDSDCFIQDVFGTEDYDCWPAETECEMSVDMSHCDHTYSVAAESDRHDAVVTSSNAVSEECMSPAGVIFSLPSLQAHSCNVTDVLPFPSLITYSDVDELCSYKQCQSGDNAAVLGVAPVELMDTGVSRATEVHDTNGCMVMDSSSYPVVEIVPQSEEDEDELIERSELSSEEPSSVVNISDSHSDNILSSDAAASSSRRAKASMVTLVLSYLFLLIKLKLCLSE